MDQLHPFLVLVRALREEATDSNGNSLASRVMTELNELQSWRIHWTPYPSMDLIDSPHRLCMYNVSWYEVAYLILHIGFLGHHEFRTTCRLCHREIVSYLRRKDVLVFEDA